MSTFPPRLKRPRNACQPIKILTIPKEPYEFLMDIECEGQIFTTIVNDKDYLKDNGLYEFTAVHLVIPKHFSKVDVDPETGEVYNESRPPLNREFNDIFALTIREQTSSLTNTIYDNNIIFDDGLDGCGIPPRSLIKSPNKNFISTNNTPEIVSNIHQLFFKHLNHYFTPFILSNGMTCYYKFEKKSVIENWVKKLKMNKEHELAVDRPLEFDNNHRILTTRDVKFVPNSENQL